MTVHLRNGSTHCENADDHFKSNHIAYNVSMTVHLMNESTYCDNIDDHFQNDSTVRNHIACQRFVKASDHLAELARLVADGSPEGQAPIHDVGGSEELARLGSDG